MIAIPVIVACSLPAMISIGISFWFLPLVGSIIAFLGAYRENKNALGFGVLFSTLSYAFIQRFANFSTETLLIMITIYLILFGTWRYTEKNLLIKRIRQHAATDISEIRRFSKKYDMKLALNLVLAGVLAYSGTMVALFGWSEEFMSPTVAGIVSIIFVALLMTVVYLISVTLPDAIKE